MSRIKPVDWQDGQYQGMVAKVLSQRDRVGSLYPILMHSEPVVDGILAIGTALRQRTALRADLREMAIVLVGELNGAVYEVFRHREIASGLGVSDERLDRVQDPDLDNFSVAECAALKLVHAITRTIHVADETYSAVAEHFTEAEVLELTAVAGYYNMISRILVPLQIGERPDTEER